MEQVSTKCYLMLLKSKYTINFVWILNIELSLKSRLADNSAKSILLSILYINLLTNPLSGCMY